MIKELKMVFEVAHLMVHRPWEPRADNPALEKDKPLDSTEGRGNERGALTDLLPAQGTLHLKVL